MSSAVTSRPCLGELGRRPAGVGAEVEDRLPGSRSHVRETWSMSTACAEPVPAAAVGQRDDALAVQPSERMSSAKRLEAGGLLDDEVRRVVHQVDEAVLDRARRGRSRGRSARRCAARVPSDSPSERSKGRCALQRGQRRRSAKAGRTADDPRVGPLMISVVIPVLNGGSDLARCLDALETQVVDAEVEVVVVDSGSTDGSAALARVARRSRARDPDLASSTTAGRATWAPRWPAARSSSSPARTRTPPTSTGSRG